MNFSDKKSLFLFSSCLFAMGDEKSQHCKVIVQESCQLVVGTHEGMQEAKSGDVTL